MRESEGERRERERREERERERERERGEKERERVSAFNFIEPGPLINRARLHCPYKYLEWFWSRS